MYGGNDQNFNLPNLNNIGMIYICLQHTVSCLLFSTAHGHIVLKCVHDALISYNAAVPKLTFVETHGIVGMRRWYRLFIFVFLKE